MKFTLYKLLILIQSTGTYTLYWSSQALGNVIDIKLIEN